MIGFELPEDVLAEIEKCDAMARAGTELVPSPDFVASFVRFQRSLRQIKQDSLAAMANVSRTTIERIERGEKVSTDSLDRVAVALGYNIGDFTKPRVPLRAEELAEMLSRSASLFEGRVEVPVRPLRTQPQVAALADCHCYLIDGSHLGETYRDQMEALREELDIIAFLRTHANEPSFKRDHKIRRRQLYARLLKTVKAIEVRAGAVALSGIYTARTDVQIMPSAEVGIIAFFLRAVDPGAVKRRVLFPPETLDLSAAWQADGETQGDYYY